MLLWLAAVLAHDPALPINPSLGVPGYPHCTRRHPGLNLTVVEAATDLDCTQRPVPAATIKIACVGDSITAGVHSSGGLHPYPQQLQLLLDAAHGPGAYAVTNLGACGSTMLKHGNSPFWKRPQYTGLVQGEWDIVTIMLGTNDAKDPGSRGPNNWQHDCGGVNATTLQNCSFAADYKAMVDVVRTLGARGTPPKIYVLIPPPLMAADVYGMNQTVINGVFPKLVPLIADANSQPDAHGQIDPLGLVDLYTPMGGEQQWASDPAFPKTCVGVGTRWPACGWFCDEQSCDQCHPNDAGYAHMANVLKIGLGL